MCVCECEIVSVCERERVGIVCIEMRWKVVSFSCR